uniref:Phytoene synthase n=1 Tax=Parastrongyloides trichosuri TaxID=131310 RepID=A0A0N4ZU50_PARTI
MNYLPSLLLPDYAKPHAFAILTLNIELATLRHSIEKNSGTAGIYRLKFWKDTVDTVFGIKKGPIPRQPTAEALKQFLLLQSTNINYIYKLITSRESTLGDRGFKSINELEEYGKNTIGNVIKLLCEGIKNNNIDLSEDIIKAADSLGKSVVIINHIRSIIPMLRKQIVLLPQDVMSLHNFTSDQLYNGKNQESCDNLIKELVNIAEFHLKESRKLGKNIDRKYGLAFVGSSLTCDFHINGLRKHNYKFNYSSLQSNDPFVAIKVGKMKLLGKY